MSDDEMSRPRVLLVEDNPDDVELIRLALEEAGVELDLVVTEDGADAIEHLRQVDPRGPLPRPDLVLLDLNLPKVDGRSVLRTIKEDTHLVSVPVLVLTTSGDDHDIRFAYQHHANGFLVKAVEYEHLVEQMRATARFWFGTVVLPPTSDPYDPYAK